ncbi:hypothetical protein INR49_022181 [Caranx melampygus]|nr:hypothetical protein INR49_022181 [Caranx melampygus]
MFTVTPAEISQILEGLNLLHQWDGDNTAVEGLALGGSRQVCMHLLLLCTTFDLCLNLTVVVCESAQFPFQQMLNDTWVAGWCWYYALYSPTDNRKRGVEGRNKVAYMYLCLRTAHSLGLKTRQWNFKYETNSRKATMNQGLDLRTVPGLNTDTTPGFMSLTIRKVSSTTQRISIYCLSLVEYLCASLRYEMWMTERGGETMKAAAVTQGEGGA